MTRSPFPNVGPVSRVTPVPITQRVSALGNKDKGLLFGGHTLENKARENQMRVTRLGRHEDASAWQRFEEAPHGGNGKREGTGSPTYESFGRRHKRHRRAIERGPPGETGKK